MRLSFSLILCFLYQSTLAQYKDRKATLINRDNEVIQGYARDYDWNKRPTSISFNDPENQPLGAILVRNIKQLKFTDGSTYEGLFLRVPYYVKTPTKSYNPIERQDSSYYLSELMLESESIKLYNFIDAEDEKRFIIAKHDSLFVLDKIHLKFDRDGLIYEAIVPEYKNVLKRLFSDCSGLSVNAVLYTEKGLSEIIKKYLACRQTTESVKFEQKKVNSPKLGIGLGGAFWPSSLGTTRSYLATIQILLPGQFYNTFIVLDGGIEYSPNPAPANIYLPSQPDTYKRPYFGIYAGRYIGNKAIQAKVYTGISRLFGFLDTGVGISYQKILSAELRYPVLNALMNNFRDDYASTLKPMFTVRAILPLNRSTKAK
jgi:hypothetical protein